MTEENTSAQEPTSPDGTPPDQNDQSVPYDRFKEVNDAKKAAEQRAAEVETQLQQFRKQQQEEKEEYKALYEQETAAREQFEAEAKQWQRYREARRETLLSQLPEDAAPIAEGIEDLNKLEQFVTRETTRDTKPPDDKAKAGRVGNMMQSHGIQTLTDAAMALKRKQITEEQHAEIRQEIQRSHTL